MTHRRVCLSGCLTVAMAGIAPRMNKDPPDLSILQGDLHEQ